MKFLLLVAIIVSALLPVAAQTTVNGVANSPYQTSSTKVDRMDSSEQELNLPPEMRARLAIERAESEYRKVLEDVEKLSNLSEEVTRHFHEDGHLSSNAMKKINTIEKLAKRVLSHAGGKEVEETAREHEGLSLPDAIEKMNTAVINIKNSMTTQTRHVVSATVIANSNEVICLSQLIRRVSK